MLAFGSVNAQNITISEINYFSHPSRNSGDWIELHNFDTASINIGKWSFVDSKPGDTAFIFPQGTMIPAGGYLVVYQNLKNFNSEYPGVKNRIGPFSFKLSKKSDTLILKDSQQVIVLKMNYSSGKKWPQGAAGLGGRTLELRNPSSNANLSSHNAWFDGCMGGSPGQAYTPCNDRVDFSEINYNSDSNYNQSEYVELHNTTANDINLTGYTLRDNKDSLTHIYYFPQGTTLAAHGYLIVSNDTAAFHAHNTSVTNYLGPFPFNLSNTGDFIRLYNINGRIMFSVCYRDSTTKSWPAAADGKGYTLELKSDTGIMDDGNNWFAGCFGGSPGYAYASPCKVLGINNIAYSNSYSIYPNPVLNILNVEHLSLAPNELRIEDLMGHNVMKYNCTSENTSLDLTNLPRGIYTLRIINNSSVAAFKFIKI